MELCYYQLLLFTLALHYFVFSAATAIQLLPNRPVPPDTICKLTPHPISCKSLLPNRPGNVYDNARFSVRKSLTQAIHFQKLVNRYLERRNVLPKVTVAALEDCLLLTGRNADFLTTSFGTINATDLSTWEAEEIQTLLSAVLTNQDTCWDGLKAASASGDVRSGLFGPIANDTELYSVSLALFTRGWVPKKVSFESMVSRKLAESGHDELKDVVVRGAVTVSRDGSGNYTTITEAVSAAPNKTEASQGYFVIYVKAGVYEEYVSIHKKTRYLMMIGDGIDRTVVTGNRSVVDGWTTFKSATFTVAGTGFVAVNITFRNTAGASKHQAVALRNSADLSTFYRCSFEGHQDTLYTHSLRQFYRECQVYGTVDFIFGNAAAVFQNCTLLPRRPMPGQFNAITAQGRSDPNQNTGITLHACTISAASDLATGPAAKTFLGRPWKAYSRTVFMQSYIGGVVDLAGWREWNGNFALDTLYYAEHNNSGPGSATAERVTWPGYHVIDASDAANFTLSSFLLADSWVPQTGVAYTSGLM